MHRLLLLDYNMLELQRQADMRKMLVPRCLFGPGNVPRCRSIDVAFPSLLLCTFNEFFCEVYPQNLGVYNILLRLEFSNTVVCTCTILEKQSHPDADSRDVNASFFFVNEHFGFFVP